MRDLQQMEAKADKYRAENKQLSKDMTELQVQVQQNEVLQKTKDRLHGDLSKLKKDHNDLIVARQEEKQAN